MARKSKSDIVGMVCKVCKSQNYVTTRNKTNIQVKSPDGAGKLELKKFCKQCKKMTLHKEKQNLK
jgi:large subunit ribosomal protein L33